MTTTQPIRIRKISTTRRGYGGNIYELYLEEFLEEYGNFERLDLSFQSSGWFRLFEFPIYLFRLLCTSLFTHGFLIRNSQAALFPLKKKGGLTIVYHIDETLSPLASRLYQRLMATCFFFFSRKTDPIVVIAQYWKDYFLNKGFTNVHLAYCPFDVSKYQTSESEIESFKQKYGLDSKPSKPLVYIGNPQLKKGTHLAYEALKNEGYELVTSGEGPLILPGTKNLSLKFDDYITLLAACDVVVTFSQFKEGWCRVAHEAILVGTPVVGSGKGGMTEILEQTGQIVCPSTSLLRDSVKLALERGKILSPKARIWAQSFDIERFRKEWQCILCELTPNLPKFGKALMALDRETQL
ncbi:MAG: glycosyltransferase [Bdellovibrionales bacterium]|nr:glycosyltransferase [Bdellovibrionales bacterium]